MSDLYERLGVGRRATTKQIKAAYLAKAKLLHPDVGGDAEEFDLVKKAYAILTDQVRRAKYDATGDETETSPLNDQVPYLTAINQLLAQVLSRDVDMRPGLMLEMRDAVRQTIDVKKQHIASCRRVISRCERYSKSFKRKADDGQPNMFEAMLEFHARQAAKQIELSEKEIEFSEAALKAISEYDFVPNEQLPRF